MAQHEDTGDDESTGTTDVLPFPSRSPTQAAYLAVAIIHNQERNMVEELLALAILAFCISTDALGQFLAFFYGYIQVHCMGLWNTDLESECRRTGDSDLRDFLLWVKMVLMATFDEDTSTWRIAIDLRQDVPLRVFATAHFDISQNFFWRDSLTTVLRDKIARHKVLKGTGAESTGQPPGDTSRNLVR